VVVAAKTQFVPIYQELSPVSVLPGSPETPRINAWTLTNVRNQTLVESVPYAKTLQVRTLASVRKAAFRVPIHEPDATKLSPANLIPIVLATQFATTRKDVCVLNPTSETTADIRVRLALVAPTSNACLSTKKPSVFAELGTLEPT
jgi:hypothetical protein